MSRAKRCSRPPRRSPLARSSSSISERRVCRGSTASSQANGGGCQRQLRLRATMPRSRCSAGPIRARAYHQGELQVRQRRRRSPAASRSTCRATTTTCQLRVLAFYPTQYNFGLAYDANDCTTFKVAYNSTLTRPISTTPACPRRRRRAIRRSCSRLDLRTLGDVKGSTGSPIDAAEGAIASP